MEKLIRFPGPADSSLAGEFVFPSGLVKKAPAGVFVPGFKNSGGQVKFGELADVLAKYGIASLRFDPRGTGYSRGKQENININSMIIDTEAAFEFLTNQERVDQQRVCFIGHSLGALIAVLMTVRHKAKCLVLMAPAIDQKKLVTDWLTSYQLDVLRSGKIIDTPKGRLGPEYIEQAESENWSNRLALVQAQTQTLIFHGQSDKDVPIDFALATEKMISGPAKLIEIAGADHKLESRNAKDIMIKETLSFLKEHL